MNDTIALLKRRRSVPPPTMTGPGPSADELTTILTVASRVPDHGKLAPWRFVVFEGKARERASAVCMNMIVAARALGFSATWLTGWMAYDGRFRAGIGLADHERIAGFIHVGRATVAIEDRSRPPLAEI